TDCSARSADSRPAPGPLTSTSSVLTPCSMAFRPASSAATCAANGVDLREPLKPCEPAVDQAIVLPWASVIVIIVLLKLAFTCAIAVLMFLRSRRRTRAAGVVAAAAGAVFSAMVPRKGLRPVQSVGADYFLVAIFLPAMARPRPLR